MRVASRAETSTKFGPRVLAGQYSTRPRLHALAPSQVNHGFLPIVV